MPAPSGPKRMTLEEAEDAVLQAAFVEQSGRVSFSPTHSCKTWMNILRIICEEEPTFIKGDYAEGPPVEGLLKVLVYLKTQGLLNQLPASVVEIFGPNVSDPGWTGEFQMLLIEVYANHCLPVPVREWIQEYGLPHTQKLLEEGMEQYSVKLPSGGERIPKNFKQACVEIARMKLEAAIENHRRDNSKLNT